MKKMKLLSVFALAIILASCDIKININNQSTTSANSTANKTEQTAVPTIAPTTAVTTALGSTEVSTSAPIVQSTSKPTVAPTTVVTTAPGSTEVSTSAPIVPSTSKPTVAPTTIPTTVLKPNKGVIYDIFGDVEIYDAQDPNPYGVNLSLYGSNISAIFYDDNLDNISDPYINVDENEFYNDYEIALTYEDAYYRTKHYLMSGDITSQTHIPGNLGVEENNKYLRANDGTYILSTSGEYLGYVVNSSKNGRIIYYGCAYTSLDDVCAYLLAFGEVPVNSHYSTSSSGKSSAIADWGIYGRVNYKEFSGDTSKYPYEPLLPTITNIYFQETDFATIGGYSCGTYYEDIYNNGQTIKRGAARIVFTADYDIKSIDERYVFYTYNHYNDFQEYLNYDGGFGLRFGNESAGNPYCSSSSDYQSSYNVPTSYPSVILKDFEAIKKLID